MLPRRGVRTLTPNHLVHVARAGLFVLLGLIATTTGAQPQVTAILCYFATVALFVACPRIRTGDLTSSAVAMLVLLCFAEAAESGVVSVTRFALAAAAIGAAVLPFKLSRIRRLAGQNGYRTLSDYRSREQRREGDTPPAVPTPPTPSAYPLLLTAPTRR